MLLLLRKTWNFREINTKKQLQRFFSEIDGKQKLIFEKIYKMVIKSVCELEEWGQYTFSLSWSQLGVFFGIVRCVIQWLFGNFIVDVSCEGKGEFFFLIRWSLCLRLPSSGFFLTFPATSIHLLANFKILIHPLIQKKLQILSIWSETKCFKQSTK